MAARNSILGAALACVLAGCASMPNVTVSYYFPKAQTQLQITQTLACSKDGKGIVAIAAVTPTTTYLSDRTVERGNFSYAKRDNQLSDADITFGFTDDGRLSTINARSTGEGDTIIKDVATIATVFVGFLEENIELLDEQKKKQKGQIGTRNEKTLAQSSLTIPVVMESRSHLHTLVMT